ncbi:MAG: FecR family protein, partial [Rikenellaceae bacterium]|nr:FecR family protein [Rikenellaceae bacterium]
MDQELLYRFFQKQTSPAQEEQIMDWIDSDPANRAAFEKERALYDVLCVGVPAALQKRSSGRSSLRRIAAAASAVAAAVALMLAFGQYKENVHHRRLSSQTTTLNVPAGQRIHIELGDGTSVWLNSGTTLEYPVIFGRQRRVRIDGEAIFDVRHDPEHPF